MEYYTYCMLYFLCLHASVGITNHGTKKGNGVSKESLKPDTGASKLQQSGDGTNLNTPKDNPGEINSLVQQLSEAIERMKDVKALSDGCIIKGAKRKCPKIKKGKKLKAQKARGNLPGALTSTRETFRSLEALFTNVSTSLSSVNKGLMEELLTMVMKAVIDKTKNLTQRVEQSIHDLTDTIDRRLDELEQHTNALLSNVVKHTTLKGEKTINANLETTDHVLASDITSAVTFAVSPDTTSAMTSTESEPIKKRRAQEKFGNARHNDQVIGSCNRWNFAELFMRGLNGLGKPMESEVVIIEVTSVPDEWFEAVVSWIYGMNIAVSVTDDSMDILAGLLSLFMFGLVVLALCWPCWRLLRTDSDQTPFLITLQKSVESLGGDTPTPLTVTTISSHCTTHVQVQTIVGDLIQSESLLQYRFAPTRFLHLSPDRTAIEGEGVSGSGSGRFLVFVDMKQGKDGEELEDEGTLPQWHPKIKERMNSMSLDDICDTLGDVIIVIYGDAGSHCLPLGAIYNRLVVEHLPVPAVRALCRVGRLLTIHTAFTNTQTQLLKHWLLSPTKVYGAGN